MKNPFRPLLVCVLLLSLVANAILWQRVRTLTDVIDREAVSDVNIGLGELRDLADLVAGAARQGRVTVAELERARWLADAVVVHLSGPVDRYNALMRGGGTKPYALMSTITGVAVHLLVLGRALSCAPDPAQGRGDHPDASSGGAVSTDRPITLTPPVLAEFSRARDYYAGLCQAAGDAYPDLRVPEERGPGFVRRREAESLLWRLQQVSLDPQAEGRGMPSQVLEDRRAWEAFQGSLTALEAMVTDLDAVLAQGVVTRSGLVDLQHGAFVATAGFELVSYLGGSRGVGRGQHPVSLSAAVMEASWRLWSVFEQAAAGGESVPLDAAARVDFTEERDRLRRVGDAARAIFPQPGNGPGGSDAAADLWRGFLRHGDWPRALDAMTRAVW